MSRRKRFTRNLGRSLGSPLPVRTTVEWVRFEHEDESYGIFRYLEQARARLAGAALLELNASYAWFNSHLDVPDVVTIERFWFCAEAEEYVLRARRLAEILRSAGVSIVETRTRRIPGKVKWQDNHQVAVLTYRDTARPGRSPKRGRKPRGV
jgi:hypothetical protein